MKCMEQVINNRLTTVANLEPLDAPPLALRENNQLCAPLPPIDLLALSLPPIALPNSPKSNRPSLTNQPLPSRPFQKIPNELLGIIISFQPPTQRLPLRQIDRRFQEISDQQARLNLPAMPPPPELSCSLKNYFTCHKIIVSHYLLNPHNRLTKIGTALTLGVLVAGVTTGIFIASGLTLNPGFALGLVIIKQLGPILTIGVLKQWAKDVIIIPLIATILRQTWLDYLQNPSSVSLSNLPNKLVQHSKIPLIILLGLHLVIATSFSIVLASAVIFNVVNVVSIAVTFSLCLPVLAVVNSQKLRQKILAATQNTLATLWTGIDRAKDMYTNQRSTNIYQQMSGEHPDILPHYYQIVGYPQVDAYISRINKILHQALDARDLELTQKLAHQGLFFNLPCRLKNEDSTQTLFERLLSLSADNRAKAALIFAGLMQTKDLLQIRALLTTLAAKPNGPELISLFINTLYLNPYDHLDPLEDKSLLLQAVAAKDLDLVKVLLDLGANKDLVHNRQAWLQDTPQKIVNALPDDGPEGVNTQLKHLFNAN